ncbi:MAG: FAD:protein FMN transferase [Bacilli bacterium]
MKKLLAILIVIFMGLGLSGCNNISYKVYTISMPNHFGTVSSVQILYVDGSLDDEAKQKLDQGCNAVLKKLDDIFNIQEENRTKKTELMLINEKAGVEPVVVSPEVIEVLKEAISVSNDSKVDGVALYDPTIGVIWNAWNFIDNGFDYWEDLLEPGSSNHDPLPQSEIDKLLPLVGFDKIIIDEEASTVYLSEVGMVLDLGSVVKGYAADKVKEYLQSEGIEKAVIDIGGNIQLLGLYVDSSDGYKDINWKIGIKTPFYYKYSEDQYTIGYINVGEATVVTSGTYEKYIKDNDGNMYHHILDPRTGQPINNGVVCVTVVTTKSIVADSLSTMLFSLGLERGMAYVENHEDIEAIYVVSDGTSNKIYASSGLESNFVFNVELTKINYSYEGALK